MHIRKCDRIITNKAYYVYIGLVHIFVYPYCSVHLYYYFLD